MPNRRLLRVLTRGSVATICLGLTTGVLALTHGSDATTFAAPKPRHVITTTTTAVTAPPVTEPPTTTPPTTAAPAPTPPTTAKPRPRTTTTVHTSPVAQASTNTVEDLEAAAMARIDYPWQSLGYSISFEPGVSGYLGLTSEGTKTIHIYVRGNESVDTLARTIAHEIGHALDFTRTSDAERQQYIAIRGIDATLDTWYSCNGSSDYTTAAGDWAETFQYWLLGPGQYWSQMGPPPDGNQLAELAPLFAPQ